MLILSAGISLSLLDMKSLCPTWRGLEHGWSQISFSSLICVWNSDADRVHGRHTHTHTNTHIFRLVGRKHHIWFMDSSTQPAPYQAPVYQQLVDLSIVMPVHSSVSMAYWMCVCVVWECTITYDISSHAYTHLHSATEALVLGRRQKSVLLIDCEGRGEAKALLHSLKDTVQSAALKAQRGVWFSD